MRKSFQVLIVLTICGIAVSGYSTIINVPADYNTIQGAIDAAVTNDTVLVAPGTYTENLKLTAKGIVLASHFILYRNPAYILNTIIDGSQPSHADTASCILIYNTDPRSVKVQGFTITKGNGTRWRDPHNSNFYREGGGILCQYASPVIQYNLIIDNDAIDRTLVSSAGGGGIRIDGGNPQILNNAIMYNRGRYGAGIVLNYTYGILKNNIIAYNSGGEDYGGGGVWKNNGNIAVLENNTIINNSSTSFGGGIVVANASLSMRNSIIYGNTASSSSQIYLATGGSLTANYCDIQGGYSGTGIIDADPQLKGTYLYFESTSPCIDSGDPSTFYNDIEDSDTPGSALWPAFETLRNDMGAYGGQGAFPFELVAIIADTTFGWIPLTVNYEAQSGFDVSNWKWHFGDGDSAITQMASHIYQTQGLFDVSLEADLSDSIYIATRNDLIAALADSVIAGDAGGSPGESIALPIYARNTVPLKKLVIPVEFSGPLNLTFDSFSTAGCRTSAFAIKEITYSDSEHAIISLQNSQTNYPPELEPGYGLALNLYFTIESAKSKSQLNAINISGFLGYEPSFSNRHHSYLPIAKNGSLTLTYICGDANGNGLVNISDITYLINFLYKHGPAPEPLQAADVNASGTVNIQDITYLINYLYKHGPAPNCP